MKQESQATGNDSWPECLGKKYRHCNLELKSCQADGIRQMVRFILKDNCLHSHWLPILPNSCPSPCLHLAHWKDPLQVGRTQSLNLKENLNILLEKKRLTLIHTHNPSDQNLFPSSQTSSKHLLCLCMQQTTIYTEIHHWSKLRVNEGIYVPRRAPLWAPIQAQTITKHQFSTTSQIQRDPLLSEAETRWLNMSWAEIAAILQVLM